MTFVRFSTEEQRERRAAEREANLRALMIPSATLHTGTYSTRPHHAPLPKGETARPGKRAPTVEERAWMDAIVAHGCIACRMDAELAQGPDGVYEPVPPQVHHILRGGRRMGHLFTLPLCQSHHQDTGRPGFVARHPWKKRFEQLYGPEMEILERLRAAIRSPS